VRCVVYSVGELTSLFSAFARITPEIMFAARVSRGALSARCFSEPRCSLAAVVYFSSSKDSNDGGEHSFRPRRRVPRSYRPLQSRRPKARGPLDPNSVYRRQDERFKLTDKGVVPVAADGEDKSWLIDSEDELESEFGPHAAEVYRHVRREAESGIPDIESQLRTIDYLTAAPGSTEDLVGERRGGMDAWNEKERRDFEEHIDKIIEEENFSDFGFGDDDQPEPVDDDDLFGIQGKAEDSSLEAQGPWSETIVRVDRVQKVERGGTTVRYRALVVGGNTNGCAGFGIGKSLAPNDATAAAVKMCKSNLFFVDRFMGSGLSYSLVGKHNSCRVLLRAVKPNSGLWGNDLICLILKYFGITDCSTKSHGNRNQFNVVRATFKALMTHESMEDIALKRGKRLLNLERAKRLRI